MKPTSYEFQWFEKEDYRKCFRASLGRNGKLHLGKTLSQVLPAWIRIGFDEKQKVLAIAEGYGEGIARPKCGVLSARLLSSQITASGLRLPISFLFVRDQVTGFFLGHILPRRRRAADTGKLEYDEEQLLILYRHIVDQAAASLAKSTPLAERRAYALEAFHGAVREYCPGYGGLERYLEENIRKKLLAENRQYAAAYGQRSLDQPLSGDGENCFCLYDTLEMSTAGGIDRLEERIMAEQFMDSLSGPEQTLSRMLREGRTLGEISRALRLTEGQLMEMGREIGRKRQEFYDC